MRFIIAMMFALLLPLKALANTLDLSTGSSEIIAAHGIKFTNLTYNNALYTVKVYFNMDGSWTLSEFENTSPLDFTTASNQIISANSINLTGLTYAGNIYNVVIQINLDGSWQFSVMKITSSISSPTQVPSTCEEKSVAFAAYSSISISCDSTTMTVTSNPSIPERSTLDIDKLNVGTEAWIGRVPLSRTSNWKVPLVPSYLSAITSNTSIHDPIGITVDGIPILHYAKESFNGEIADLNTDYSSRDTVLLGELDQCGAHAGNGEDYHYHYAPLCMMDNHDPSQPLAYMFDGLPLYFGTAGGTVSSMGGITNVNYGANRYSDLDYRPESVKNGTNSLDACNAYDINGDGATSGYVYYTTKEAPYTIGCYRAQADQSGSSDTPSQWDQERDISWSGSDVLLSDYYQSTFEGNSWTFMEMTPGETNNKLAEGTTGAILYRKLVAGDTGYTSGLDCWSFRYRLDKTDTTGSNDNTETRCR